MPDIQAKKTSAQTVALPETRQLDVLAGLLERRNFAVVRCPMVAIEDAPDPEPVVAWLGRQIASPPDLLILYTGEGLYRLQGFAERAGLEAAFVESLRRSPILTRGPKPVRALRALGIRPDYEAAQPTTQGIIATLEGLPLEGRLVRIQLFGADPNEALVSWLHSRNAQTDCVAPYVYASQSDDAQVEALIRGMHDRTIDAIAFTSKSQYDRLRRVAARAGLTAELENALNAVIVAAVGPVVADELDKHGVRVDLVPEQSFHMKPLVQLLVDRLAASE